MASSSDSCFPSTSPLAKVSAYSLAGGHNGNFPDLKSSTQATVHLHCIFNQNVFKTCLEYKICTNVLENKLTSLSESEYPSPSPSKRRYGTNRPAQKHFVLDSKNVQPQK